jgi:hypothetical protein
MWTAGIITFWLHGLVGRTVAFNGVAKSVVDAVLWRAPEERRRLAMGLVRASRVSRAADDSGAEKAFLFLAGLLLYSIRMDRLTRAQRVNLRPSVGGYSTVYVDKNEDGLFVFLDERADEIRSLDLIQQGQIVIEAERARGAAPNREPPPKSAGPVSHSRNPVGSRSWYQRVRA